MSWLTHLLSYIYNFIHLRLAYLLGRAIYCSFCRQLAWGGFHLIDGRWQCCGCARETTRETTRPTEHKIYKRINGTAHTELR